jgi:regulator of protease activity HflC (stomatin/prohibitin superfamily)
MANSQLSQTTLRSVIGRAEWTKCFPRGTRINQELQQIIDERTDPGGSR